MIRGRRSGAELAQRKSFQDIEDLDQVRRRRRRAAASRRCRNHGKYRAHRPHDRLIALQIVRRHDAAVGAHACDDLLGERSLVEGARALCGNRLQRCREIGLHQPVAACERRAVALQEDFRGRRPAREPQLRARQRVGELVIDLEPFAREPDGGPDQLREREFAGAVFLMRKRKPRNRAGHADTER